LKHTDPRPFVVTDLASIDEVNTTDLKDIINLTATVDNVIPHKIT
jgi:hypothetical protein